MLVYTHHAASPWLVVQADDKHAARISLIHNLLTRLDYPNKVESVLLADPGIVFTFEREQLDNGMIAP